MEYRDVLEYLTEGSKPEDAAADLRYFLARSRQTKLASDLSAAYPDASVDEIELAIEQTRERLNGVYDA